MEKVFECFWWHQHFLNCALKFDVYSYVLNTQFTVPDSILLGVVWCKHLRSAVYAAQDEDS